MTDGIREQHQPRSRRQDDRNAVSIEKSVASNRASDVQIRALLAPLFEAIAPCFKAPDTLLAEEPQIHSAHKDSAVALTAGERAALHLADRASVRELIAALMGCLDGHADKFADHGDAN